MSSHFIRIYLKILYKSYLKRFFDIESHLILEMNPFKYNIYMKFLRYDKNTYLSPYMNQAFTYYEDKIEDRLYNQILTQEEANAFIEKSKKKFISCLKQLKI